MPHHARAVVAATAVAAAALAVPPAAADPSHADWMYAADPRPIVHQAERDHQVLRTVVDVIDDEVWIAVAADRAGEAVPAPRAMRWLRVPREYRCATADDMIAAHPTFDGHPAACLPDDTYRETTRPGWLDAVAACQTSRGGSHWRPTAWDADTSTWVGCDKRILDPDAVRPLTRPGTLVDCAPWESTATLTNGRPACDYAFYTWGGETPRHPSDPQPGYATEPTNPVTVRGNPDGTHTATTTATRTGTLTLTRTVTAKRARRLPARPVTRTVTITRNGRTFTGTARIRPDARLRVTVSRTAPASATRTATATGSCTRSEVGEAIRCAVATADTAALAAARAAAHPVASAAAAATARRQAQTAAATRLHRKAADPKTVRTVTARATRRAAKQATRLARARALAKAATTLTSSPD